MVESDLLIPGDARDQMVNHVARLPPRPASYQQPEETRAETSRAALVFERHQVVLGELPQPVQIKTKVRNQHEHGEKGERQAVHSIGEVSIDAVV